MSEPYDSLSRWSGALALYDALNPDEQAALERTLNDNPVLAEAFRRWRGLRAEVRRELAEALPDRALLVLYALSDEALPGEAPPEASEALLNAAEQARLDGVRHELRAVLVKHPGLVAAVRRIRDDRAAFDRVWNIHVRQNGRATAVASTSAEDRPAVQGRRRPRRRSPGRRSPAWRVGALVAVVAFGAVLVFLGRRDAGWEGVRVAEATTLPLPDGSTADLAAGAQLLIPEADGGRDARQVRLLAGRALFAVRHDPDHPFTVETPNATVTVLGTTFGVEVDDRQTEVVLVEGAVVLASRAGAEAPVRLAPGQRSRVLALDAPSAPAPADLDAALDWTGALFIRDEAMATAVDRLSRAFGVPVEVDAALAGEMISATRFEREEGIEAALDELAMALGARVVERPEGGFRIEAVGAE